MDFYEELELREDIKKDLYLSYGDDYCESHEEEILSLIEEYIISVKDE